MKVYIAGPMRGYNRWNFDAFDEAEERWRNAGHEPASPASIDRALGVDPDLDGEKVLENGFVRQAMQLDIALIYNSDAIALLPGWEGSRGSTVELSLAQYLGLQVFDAVTMQPIYPPLSPWSLAKTEGDGTEKILGM